MEAIPDGRERGAGGLPRRDWLRAALGALGLSWAGPAWRAEGARGDAVIRAGAGRSEIVITTTDRLAGAIHSLTWGGREFIDSADHGRQLQSAINLDTGRAIHDETYNPTEAGARDDGAGPASSSRLRALRARGNTLETSTQMAFWLPPGGRSGPFPAYNTTGLSDFLLTKTVTIGRPGWPHAIDYRVTFELPRGERHTRAVFEVLTGYMPPLFDTFWGLDRTRADRLVPLDAGPGEQPRPIVLATADGAFAMGVVAPGPAPRGCAGPTYGRFTFPRERVNKWNCVFRAHDAAGLAPGRYTFGLIVAVGTRAVVSETLAGLAGEARRR